MTLRTLPAALLALAPLVVLCGCPKKANPTVSTLAPPPPVSPDRLGRFLLVPRNDAKGRRHGAAWCYLDIAAEPTRPDRMVVKAWRPDDVDPFEGVGFDVQGSNVQLTLTRRYELTAEESFETTQVFEEWRLSGTFGSFPPIPEPPRRVEKPDPDAMILVEEEPPPPQDMTPQPGISGTLVIEQRTDTSEVSRTSTYRFLALRTAITDTEAASEYEDAVEAAQAAKVAFEKERVAARELSITGERDAERAEANEAAKERGR